MKGEAQTKLSDFFLLSYSSASRLDQLPLLTRAEQSVSLFTLPKKSDNMAQLSAYSSE